MLCVVVGSLLWNTVFPYKTLHQIKFYYLNDWVIAKGLIDLKKKDRGIF